MTNQQLQIILDALDNGLPEARKEAIAIVKQMMQAEPVVTLREGDSDIIPAGTKLYTHTAPQAVPAGFVLVPVEPTPEMCKAARAVPDASKPYPPHFHLIWDAMLAAAPKGAV